MANKQHSSFPDSSLLDSSIPFTDPSSYSLLANGNEAMGLPQDYLYGFTNFPQ